MLSKKEEKFFESCLNLIFLIVALAVILWCFGIWRQDPAHAGEYQDGYRDGYEYREDGMPSLPPMPAMAPMPVTGADPFIRGVLDGHEAHEEENNQEEEDNA